VGGVLALHTLSQSICRCCSSMPLALARYSWLAMHIAPFFSPFPHALCYPKLFSEVLMRNCCSPESYKTVLHFYRPLDLAQLLVCCDVPMCCCLPLDSDRPCRVRHVEPTEAQPQQAHRSCKPRFELPIDG